jgi:phosphoribosylglycinamide formyltransferase 1
VLASGRGSNLRAICAAGKAGNIPGTVDFLLSDNPESGAAEFARSKAIEVVEIPRGAGEPRARHDARLLHALRQRNPDLICLAGYMRLVGREIVEAFRWKLLNIHPSLLPAFPGLAAQRQALAAGVKVTGCTVHFVDEGLDSGPIVLQRAVPVLDSDDEAALSERILAEEHFAYPAAIRVILEGRWIVRGRRVCVDPSPDRGIAESEVRT